MENNKEPNSKWVEERMASLKPQGEWKPNEARSLARLRTKQSTRRSPGRRWTWVVALTAMTGLGMASTPATRDFTSRCVDACIEETGQIQWFVHYHIAAFHHHIHNLFMHMSSGGGGTASVKAAGERKAAPEFALLDASGNPVKLADFQGKVVLLNFWATWCGPCKVEIPWFDEFQDKFPDKDFAVLGVSMDDDGWKSVRPYVEDKKIGYRMVVGNDDVAKLYGGVESLPMTFVIDKSGRIAATHEGLYGKPAYEAEIRALLGER